MKADTPEKCREMANRMLNGHQNGTDGTPDILWIMGYADYMIEAMILEEKETQ